MKRRLSNHDHFKINFSSVTMKWYSVRSSAVRRNILSDTLFASSIRWCAHPTARRHLYGLHSVALITIIFFRLQTARRNLENTANNKHNEAETYVKINCLSYEFPCSGSVQSTDQHTKVQTHNRKYRETNWFCSYWAKSRCSRHQVKRALHTHTSNTADPLETNDLWFTILFRSRLPDIQLGPVFYISLSLSPSFSPCLSRQSSSLHGICACKRVHAGWISGFRKCVKITD